MWLGARLVPSGTSQGAAVASATTQFHWQDPSLSTECSRCEKPFACFSVLGVAGSSPDRTSYPNLPTAPLSECMCSCGVDSLRAPKKNDSKKLKIDFLAFHDLISQGALGNTEKPISLDSSLYSGI